MSTSKKKSLLIDVARKLFAQKGLNGTTMNDIANESGISRRTLYVYFANKEEIYSAVIETEIERLSEKMDEVASRDIDPELKVATLIYTHLNAVKETVVRNGTLRAEFFRNIWMVEKVRKQFDAAEQDVFYNVLKEGRDNGKFIIEDVRLMADIIHYTLKGLEVPYIYGRLGNGMKEAISRPIVAGLVRRALGMGPLR